MSSIFVFGKQVLGSTYVKLLVALEKISSEMRLDTLPKLSCRSRNSNIYVAISIVNCIFFCTVYIVHVVKKQIKISSEIL